MAQDADVLPCVTEREMIMRWGATRLTHPRAPTGALRRAELGMTEMTIEETIVEKVRALPPERQQEVLDFVEFLQQRATATGKRPLRSVKGLWSDLDVNITEEDIAEVRREMWRNFPREFPRDSPERE